jgi:hypothetical protein
MGAMARCLENRYREPGLLDDSGQWIAMHGLDVLVDWCCWAADLVQRTAKAVDVCVKCMKAPMDILTHIYPAGLEVG